MNKSIYHDIAKRTDGNIYIGVVGPVRSGKSTFISRFMQSVVIPRIESDFRRERAVDELPQSAAGKTIMTTEPKFIPEDAITIMLDDNASMNVRLIDCVGYIIPSSIGYIENDMPRMVMTPWFDTEIPFNMAAEVGTQKVINEHSTIGLVVTTDGSITGIAREEYAEAEERVVNELKNINKPFVVILNCQYPESFESISLAKELSEKYGQPVIPLNCLEITEKEIKDIMEEILLRFPIKEVNIRVPKWLNSLEKEHWLKRAVFDTLKAAAADVKTIGDVKLIAEKMKTEENVSESRIDEISLGNGAA